jgi:hypothetical protein
MITAVLKYKFIFILFFLSFSAIAQIEPDPKEEFTRKPCEPWEGFLIDIGFNQYKSAHMPALNAWGSKGVNVYYYYGIPLSCKITLAPGFGLGLDGYTFEEEGIRISSSSTDSLIVTYPAVAPGTFRFEKSKLAVNHFDIPLELRFETGKYLEKTFRMAIGGKIGFVYNSHTKVKYTNLTTGQDVKEKTKDDFGIQGFRYGLTARVGYGYFNLFGYYSLSSLLRNNKGPEATPFVIGITLSPNYYFKFQ